MDHFARTRILHILMWNYKDDVPKEERSRLEALLAALPSKIPGLNSVHWGPVFGGRNQSFSHCFIMEFSSRESLDAYAPHPEHAQFAVPFREACATQVVVDVEAR